MSMASRRMMLVPLPLALQHFLTFASDNVPTVTLLTFVVIQFVLNILHYIPAKYWRLWVDRTRFVLKTLLDSDFRHDKYQLDILRQRLAESDRRNAASTQEIELSTETNKNLKERLFKLNQEADQKRIEYSGEVTRIKGQLDAQTKLLEETEAHLDALRAGGDGKVAILPSNEKRQLQEKISSLEKHIASLIKERKETSQEVANMKATHLSFQERFEVLGQANLQLLHEKQELSKQLENLRTRELQLVASRDQFLGRLNTELQNSSAAKDSAETLKTQLHEAETSKAVTERLLQDAQQQLEAAQAQSKESQEKVVELQGKLKDMQESQGNELKQLGQTEASERVELEEIKTKLAQLEASLAGTVKSNEDLKQEVESKNEEIARLTDALELANSRHYKLIKPRQASHDSSSRPITPPPGHHRSSSISSRKFSFTKQSPSSSPVHRMQVPLPSTTTTADTSVASSIGSGSTTLTPPSLGKSHKKSRQRLSSILGIHLGTPEKDK